MLASEKDQPALSEEIWRAWVEKGKRRDRAAARKAKIFTGITLIVLVLGSVFYTFTVR